MKERPILMNARSVRGILDGMKTQTRRIIKPQPIADETICQVIRGKYDWVMGRLRDSENAWRELKCPYGQPGDRLWVRETHHILDGRPGILNYLKVPAPTEPWSAFVTYKADDHLSALIENIPPECWHESFDNDHVEWRPSIHMPRWASRLTLEITDVRVERVQDISYKDAEAEGVADDAFYEALEFYDNVLPPGERSGRPDERNWFAELWDETNGKGAWNRNDWVWVLSFRRVE